jgi:drug/metabolite transporter (DMT)-like permease
MAGRWLMIHNLPLVILLMVVSTLIGSVGSLLLKKGSARFNMDIRKGVIKTIRNILNNYFVITGAVLYVVSAGFFIYLLRLEDLSMLYPMSSLSYVFVTILSVYFLKEKMNHYKILGVIAIIAGVVMVTM